MIFLKNKFQKEINSNKIECIEKGIYYGKKEARVFGMGHIEEKRIH